MVISQWCVDCAHATEDGKCEKGVTKVPKEGCMLWDRRVTTRGKEEDAEGQITIMDILNED